MMVIGLMDISMAKGSGEVIKVTNILVIGLRVKQRGLECMSGRMVTLFFESNQF